MKVITGSIILLSATMFMIAAKYFDSTLFWVLGVLFLIEGAVLINLSLFFPSFFKDTRKWLRSLKEEETSQKPTLSS